MTDDQKPVEEVKVEVPAEVSSEAPAEASVEEVKSE